MNAYFLPMSADYGHMTASLLSMFFAATDLNTQQEMYLGPWLKGSHQGTACV